MTKKVKAEIGPKTGAVATSPAVLAAATLYVPRRRSPMLMAVDAGPPAVFVRIPAQLSMWGNIQYSDCVAAEEAFACACYDPEIFITEDVVIAWATANNFLTTADCGSVMQVMQKSGFVQNGHTYGDGAFSPINPTDPVALNSAIWEGPVKAYVASAQLKVSWGAAGNSAAGARNGWLATGYAADNAYDHCVSLCGYGDFATLAAQLGAVLPAAIDGASAAYAVFSWGSIGLIDELSMLAIISEAWLRSPTTVIA